MTARAPPAPVLRIAASTLLALTAAGCTRAEYRLREVESAYLDLAAEHGRADCWAEVEALRLSAFSARTHLVRGWSFPGESPHRPYPGAWAQSRTPGLRLWIVEPGLRTVAFQVRGAQGIDRLPPDPARLLLNGAAVGEFRIAEARTWVELPLPPELQRPGLNELEFEIPHGIRPSSDHADSEDVRFLTGYFSDLVVRVEDPGLRRRSAQRAELVPGGSRVVCGGAALEQVSGSVVRHALELPARSVFESEILADEDVRFRVRLRDDSGTDVLVVDELLADERRPRLVRADLTEYGGRAVELELALESAGDPGVPVRGVWGRPVLLAEPPAVEGVAPDVAAALERARRRLARAPVIVILLDAFNPDFMSAYGGREGLTPHLDRLAREGKRFDRAFTSAAYTIAAVASVLTSTPAWNHGAQGPSTRLIDSVETWAARFALAGYRTAAVVCSPNGSSLFGFERGFEQFLEVFRDLPRAGWAPIRPRDVLAGLEAVIEADDGRPLFLWMHVLEPHEPYGSPVPVETRLDPEYTGQIDGDVGTIVDIHAGRIRPSARDQQHLRSLYEEGVAYADDLVGRIRARLEGHGAWEEAVVVLLSDHGEAFLAHSTDEYIGMGHNSSTFSDMTRIPLVVRLPAGAGLDPSPTRAPVSNIDLFCTLADLVGVPLPSEAEGTSFAPVLFGAEHGGRRQLVVHSTSFHSERFLPELALLRGGYKYVYSTGAEEALYDLSEDLLETHDLVREKPVLAAVLRQELRRAADFDFTTGERRVQAGARVIVDDEVQRQLEALGYGR